MKLRKLKKHLQEKHGYWNVEYNSRGPKEWKYDPFTGEDYGYRRSRYKLRVTTNSVLLQLIGQLGGNPLETLSA